MKLNINFGWGNVMAMWLIVSLFLGLALNILISYKSLEKKPLIDWQTAPQAEITEFMQIGERFAQNHDYIVDKFTCVNYTNEFAKVATELGFKVKKIQGCPANHTGLCHEWIRVEVDYEPQQGSFIDYSEEFPDQQIIK